MALISENNRLQDVKKTFDLEFIGISFMNLLPFIYK